MKVYFHLQDVIGRPVQGVITAPVFSGTLDNHCSFSRPHSLNRIAMFATFYDSRDESIVISCRHEAPVHITDMPPVLDSAMMSGALMSGASSLPIVPSTSSGLNPCASTMAGSYDDSEFDSNACTGEDEEVVTLRFPATSLNQGETPARQSAPRVFASTDSFFPSV